MASPKAEAVALELPKGTLLIGTVEKDGGFILIKECDTIESTTTFEGWHFDQPGVLIKKTIKTKDKTGVFVATNTTFEFKPGAAIREHCVDDKITSGDLVGGEL